MFDPKTLYAVVVTGILFFVLGYRFSAFIRDMFTRQSQGSLIILALMTFLYSILNIYFLMVFVQVEASATDVLKWFVIMLGLNAVGFLGVVIYLIRHPVKQSEN